jgi:hypothetical protein
MQENKKHLKNKQKKATKSLAAVSFGTSVGKLPKSAFYLIEASLSFSDFLYVK